MRIPLDCFEQHIDSTILERGLKYYSKGLVGLPEEVSPGRFEAIVSGTRPYDVAVELSQDAVVRHSCNCPYDMGPVCKHVAAVIFALQSEVLGLGESKSNTTRKRRRPPGSGKAAVGAVKTSGSRKTIAEKIDDILSTATHDDLKIFVREWCEREKYLRDSLLARYMPADENPAALYRAQVASLIASAKGRHGFIEYHQSINLARSIQDILQQAQQNISAGRSANGAWAAMAVIEKTGKSMESVDDSSGSLQDCIAFSLNLLEQAAPRLPEGKSREELYDALVKCFEKETLSFISEWHYALPAIAADAAPDAQSIRRVTMMLEQAIRNSENEYSVSYAHRAMLKIKEKAEGDDAALAYMKKNANDPDIRARLAARALENKNYDEALRLAHAGLADRKYPGLAEKWREFIATVLRDTGRKEELVDLLQKMITQSDEGLDRHYNELKSLVAPDLWSGFINSLIRKIDKDDKYGARMNVLQIYIWEERWGDMMNVLRKYPSPTLIESLAPYLDRRFPEEIAALYEAIVLEDASRASSRSQYKVICRYIRRIKKLGAHDRAEALVAKLRAEYPSRRALLEELSNV